nr:MAG TPA: hypothetical protein [Caudoviricetes sp.]
MTITCIGKITFPGWFSDRFTLNSYRKFRRLSYFILYIRNSNLLAANCS